MAGLLNNLLDYLKMSDEDDYEEYDDFEEERDEPELKDNRRVEYQEKRTARKNSRAQREEVEEELPRRERSPKSERASKVVPMRGSSRELGVRIIKPKSFEDSEEVCETLIKGQPVVVNLEGFDDDDAQRIMDFISGCLFAIDGKLHRISRYIFIFSPANVDISGDYLDFLPEDKKNTITINKGF